MVQKVIDRQDYRNQIEKKLDTPIVRAVQRAAKELLFLPEPLGNYQGFEILGKQYEIRFYEREELHGQRVFCLSVWQKDGPNLERCKQKNYFHAFDSGEIAFRVFILKYHPDYHNQGLVSSYSETRTGFEGMGLSLALIELSDLAINTLLRTVDDFPDEVRAVIFDQAIGKKNPKFRKGWTSAMASFIGYNYENSCFFKTYTK